MDGPTGMDDSEFCALLSNLSTYVVIHVVG